MADKIGYIDMNTIIIRSIKMPTHADYSNQRGVSDKLNYHSSGKEISS